MQWYFFILLFLPLVLSWLFICASIYRYVICIVLRLRICRWYPSPIYTGNNFIVVRCRQFKISALFVFDLNIHHSIQFFLLITNMILLFWFDKIFLEKNVKYRVEVEICKTGLPPEKWYCVFYDIIWHVFHCDIRISRVKLSLVMLFRAPSHITYPS